MVFDFDIKYLLKGRFYCLNARIAEFHYTVAFGADQVIVLLVAVGLLVLRQILSELMLAYKVALNQEVQRVINGRPAYTVIFVLHADVK